jgi:cell division protein FtsL
MKKNKKRITKLERFLYKTGSVIIIALIVGIVFGETALAQVNLEVQYLKDEVEEKENTNTSLTMKINEMASLENIEEVSENEGLSYNSENIKTIK